LLLAGSIAMVPGAEPDHALKGGTKTSGTGDLSGMNDPLSRTFCNRVAGRFPSSRRCAQRQRGNGKKITPSHAPFVCRGHGRERGLPRGSVHQRRYDLATVIKSKRCLSMRTMLEVRKSCTKCGCPAATVTHVLPIKSERGILVWYCGSCAATGLNRPGFCGGRLV
jgi:hypothetical protein